MPSLPRTLIALLGAACAATAGGVAEAGAKVWDSRDLWATPPAGSGDMDARLTGSFAQFADWPVYVAVVVSCALAVGLSWLLAYAARARGDRSALGVECLEERRTLVLVGLASAVAAFVASVEPAMALVLVALGLALRADGLVRSPEMRARFLLVVSVGAAAGLSQYLLALLAALVGLVVLRWIGGSRYARVKVRVALGTDRERAKSLIGVTLARMNCRVLGAREGRSGRALVLTVRIPSGVTDELLAKGLAASIGAELGPITVEIRER